MKIRLFKDEPPLCFNLEKWGINNIPRDELVVLTGLSGSGKTTFAKKYALQHKAVCISFDVLKFYPQSSIESQQILNLFLKQYPDIQQFIDIQWSKTDKQNSNDIFFNYYFLNNVIIQQVLFLQELLLFQNVQPLIDVHLESRFQ